MFQVKSESLLISLTWVKSREDSFTMKRGGKKDQKDQKRAPELKVTLNFQRGTAVQCVDEFRWEFQLH